MGRYYELLTDVSLAAIEQMKADAAAGRQHPMELKKALARRIVQDFHGEQAAKAADENWAKQFQKDEVPEDAPSVEIKFVEVSFQNIYVSSSNDEGLGQKYADIDIRANWNKLDRTKYFPALLRLDRLVQHAGLVA